MLLIDGIGGALTAVMLGLVLPSFSATIGLPPRVLVMLGLFGVGYAGYSLCCSRLVRTRWRPTLTIIIVANLVYCAISALVLATYRNTITPLGVAYFLVEIMVILVLVGAEIAVFRRCPTEAP